MRNVTEILGVKVNLENYHSAIEKIKERIDRKQPTAYVTLMSANNLVHAQRDEDFRNISNRAYLALPDGISLVWLARANGAKMIKSNVRGTDFFRKFFDKTCHEGYKHFFYGGKEGIASQLKKYFENRLPDIKITGIYSPPFRKLTEYEDKKICDMINSSKADIVWVGLSTPKQERWMSEHIDKINAPLMIGVGAAFDFIAGNKKETPAWMRSNGLEWIYRLITEPRRLWKRYLIGNALLVYWLIKEKMNKKRS